MAFRDLRDMGYDDEEMLDRAFPREVTPPEYPPGLIFSMTAEDLAKAEAEGGEPGDTMRFGAMGEVTSIMKGRDDCRIEIELSQFAGEEGEFFELEDPCHICLCGPELAKMGLEADCELGDMIHLIGEVRMESFSSNEFGGDRYCLQITHLNAVHDESEENRDHSER